jgi:putative cardiolipin synthase
MDILRRPILVVVAAAVTACATVPGADYPKDASTALAQPEGTSLGREFAAVTMAHQGESGFHLLVQGVDSFLVRAEMARAAERTLDLEYFIFQDDDSGKLLVDSLLKAAERGVRVRLLVDDNDDVSKNSQLAALVAHSNVEVRVFNPFNLRWPLDLLRYTEFLVTDTRINYRMHNKLFIADNSVAVTGGRNVGDEYFQIDPKKGFADFDVLAVGPVVPQLSKSFDAYWNSDKAIPLQALMAASVNHAALRHDRAERTASKDSVEGQNLERHIAQGNPLKGLLNDPKAFVYSTAEVLSDPADKREVEAGEKDGPLMRRRVVAAVNEVNSELLITSPYLVPGEGGMRLLERVRARGVEIRIITNSLVSTEMPIAHIGYAHYRKRLLEDGVDLCEMKPSPGEPDVGAMRIDEDAPRRFSLHGKVFVFDRKRVFIGSMNFDRRSLRVNTEMGLIIDSPELAQQVASHFDALSRPANCFTPVLKPPDAFGHRALEWRTEDNGKQVVLEHEPKENPLFLLDLSMLSLLPIDDLL